MLRISSFGLIAFPTIRIFTRTTDKVLPLPFQPKRQSFKHAAYYGALPCNLTYLVALFLHCDLKTAIVPAFIGYENHSIIKLH